MTEFNKRLNDLAEQLIELYNNLYYGNTWNEYIKMMQTTLDLIFYTKENEVEEHELIILNNLVNEALNLVQDSSISKIKSSKRKKLKDLTILVKDEMSKQPLFNFEEPITDFNSWIKSLKIFKMGDSQLEEQIYETSYELYQGMRKIILKKSSPRYKKIYLSKIIERLESEENLQKLPNNIRMEAEDYELSQIIRLVKFNPEFDYRNNDFGILTLTKADNLDRQTNICRVRMLTNR